MRISLARVGHCFLALTAVVVTLAVLHVWEIVVLEPATLLRLGVTYVLVSGLLGATAAVGTWQQGSARNRDGDRLID
jgi:hypothetical protein